MLEELLNWGGFTNSVVDIFLSLFVFILAYKLIKTNREKETLRVRVDIHEEFFLSVREPIREHPEWLITEISWCIAKRKAVGFEPTRGED